MSAEAHQGFSLYYVFSEQPDVDFRLTQAGAMSLLRFKSLPYGFKSSVGER